MKLTTEIITITLAFLAFATPSFAQVPEMVLVEGGTFLMGSDNEDLEETPIHSITLNSFYVSKYEVKNKDYKLFCFMAGVKPPNAPDEMPVVNINWNDAVKYCNWLSDMEGLAPCYLFVFNEKAFRARYLPGKNGYRLLTEAEWEYAANGGNKSRKTTFAGSSDPTEVGWIDTSSKLELHLGGLKKPNELGIYDMTGNCLEWCSDWYDKKYYKSSPKTNPPGADTGSQKSCRGGNFNSSKRVSTNTNRLGLAPELTTHYTGLRIGRTK